MKVIPETRRAHEMCYLRFYYHSLFDYVEKTISMKDNGF